MLLAFMFWLPLILSTYLLVEVAQVIEGKYYTRCQLAKELFFAKDISWKDIPDWICLAESATGLNSSFIQHFPNKSHVNYGIFRISSEFWCQMREGTRAKKNICGQTCSDLLNVTISISCAHRITTLCQKNGKFLPWIDWRKKCKGQANITNYIEGCEVVDNQRKPTILTEERQKVLEVGSTWQTLTCEANGNPIPEVFWDYNKTEFPNLVVTVTRTTITAVNMTILVIPGITQQFNNKEFKCIAESFSGIDQALFIIKVVDPKVNNVHLYYLLGIGITIILVLIASLIFIRRRRIANKSAKLLSKSEIKEFIEGNPKVLKAVKEQRTGNSMSGEFAWFQPYNQDYELDESLYKIDSDTILGSGHFGQVMKCQDLRSGHTIAVKTTRLNKTAASNNNNSKLYLKSLLTELKIMIHLGEHPFIASLIGANTQNIQKGQLLIFVEYCELGDLENYLRKHRDAFFDDDGDKIVVNIGLGTTYKANNYEDGIPKIPIENDDNKKDDEASQLGLSHYIPFKQLWEAKDKNCSSSTCTNKDIQAADDISRIDLYRWSTQISKAMEFLASKKVIHGDLSTRNVLLVNKETAKVTDFGLGKHLYNYSEYIRSGEKQVPLPWRWLSVESLTEMSFSTQSDVWSFGITLWEIFSLCEIPYSGGILFSNEFVQGLQNGYRLQKPKYASKELYDKMFQCWNPLPDERPTFLQLTKWLQHFFDELNNNEKDIQFKLRSLKCLTGFTEC